MRRVMVPVGDPIIDEWARLQWEDEERKKEDKRQDNHESDAALYAWREAKHYHYTPAVAPPVRNSAEWFAAEEQRMLDAAIADSRGREAPAWREKNAMEMDHV